MKLHYLIGLFIIALIISCTGGIRDKKYEAIKPLTYSSISSTNSLIKTQSLHSPKGLELFPKNNIILNKTNNKTSLNDEKQTPTLIQKSRYKYLKLTIYYVIVAVLAVLAWKKHFKVRLPSWVRIRKVLLFWRA